jgi:Clathrin adaptor complex small chain
VRVIPNSISTRYLLLQNRQGKARLSKWWVHDEDIEKHKVAIEMRAALPLRPCLFSS